MKSSTNKKRFALAITLAVPLFIMSGASTHFHDGQCTAASQADGTCITKQGANKSWLNWFSGGSRSTQFQFIDLFELVNSPKEDTRKTVLPTREG
jgi:hypothetical protein